MNKDFWKRLLCGSFWKKLFPLPVWIDLSLFTACCASLIWVFISALEQWWPAYFLYGLSAYTLSALCFKLPGAIRTGKTWLNNHPRVEHLLKDRERMFCVKLYLEQLLNFAYGVFKIAAGVVMGSAWVGTDGIYKFVQALIQLFQILRR